MKEIYFFKKKVFILFALFSVLFYFIGVQQVCAQAKLLRVTGTVTSIKGETLPGVNIIIKGTTTGTVTDLNGKYTLSKVPSNATLVFSFVGMQHQEIPVNDRSVINITLSSSSLALNQVVVVGYGTAKKATLTGSVTSVKGDKVLKIPSTNISNALSGQLPGLIVMTPSGEPGADNSMLLVRGNNTLGDNSPLIVVDGIPGRNLSRLDPNDIKSITILKDASAAIYGSRAANGVILVTTKRGSAGKPKLSITYNQGWNQPTVIPHMADAATYAQMLNEINLYRGTPPVYSAKDIEKFKNGSDPWGHPNTNWFAATFKTAAPQRQWNASLSGGTKTIRYFVSIGSKYEDGIYKHSATSYSQYNFRSNINATITKNIHLSFDLSGTEENRHYPTRSVGDIFWMLMRGKPTLPAYWPNGLPGPDIEYGNNPVVITTDKTGYDQDKTYLMTSNIKLDITIPGVKGISLTGNIAADKNIDNHKVWRIPWYLYTWDGISKDSITGQPILEKGQRGFSTPNLRQSMIDGGNLTFNAYANYVRNFSEKSHFKAMIGFEATTGNSMNFWAYRDNFLSSSIDQLFAGGKLNMNDGGSASHNARMSYFGRLNYDYMSKYLVEFIWREDGSYIFPKGHRYGFFPGISVGWVISSENFWNKSSIFNFFKLRASWGQVGNDRIDPYQFLSTYLFNPNSTYVFNKDVEEKLLSESVIANPNVTWEVANETNIGFDAQMFGGKLSISGEYFYNYRFNILWWRNASVPTSTGLNLPRENIGKVANQGYNFNVKYSNHSKKLHYSVGVNGGYAKNKIIFWDETPGVPIYQQSTGHPMNTGLYYKAIGIFKDQAAVDAYPHWDGARPGDIIFKDVNNDGVINGLDRVRIDKNSVPRFTGGLNFLLGYNRFFMTLALQGATGAVRYNYTDSGEIGDYLYRDAHGRWTVNNPNASKPRAWNRQNEYWKNQQNTYWLESTNYIRLKNLQIGYKLINNKSGISSLSVYFSGMNLLTLTKLKDFDPESTLNGYPPSRVYNVGCNITF